MAAYNPDVVNVNARPTPDHCKLFLPTDIKNLVANKSISTVLTAVETMLKTAVDKHLPILVASSSPSTANDMVTALFIQAAHMVWGGGRCFRPPSQSATLARESRQKTN